MTTRTVSTQADLDAALGMCKLHWRQSRTAPQLVAVAIRVLAARGASDLAEMLGLTGGRVVAS